MLILFVKCKQFGQNHKMAIMVFFRRKYINVYVIYLFIYTVNVLCAELMCSYCTFLTHFADICGQVLNVTIIIWLYK